MTNDDVITDIVWVWDAAVQLQHPTIARGKVRFVWQHRDASLCGKRRRLEKLAADDE